MTAADQRSDETPSGHSEDEPDAPTSRPNRLRAVLGVLVLAVVIIAASVTIYGQRHDFARALRHVGAGPMFLSFLLGVLGLALTYPSWRAVLAGLGVSLPLAPGARVFFVSQLGKYIPGSVWPVLMQMEAGRRYGASRRTMITANLLTLLLGCTVGLIIAGGVLPFANASALHRYWPLLLALPFLLALLHPRAVPWLLDRLFMLVRREPLGERLPLMASARASGWGAASMLCQGLHVAVLAVALGGGSLSVALAVGGMALAVSAGVLFIPAPAGAGVRDVVLSLVLQGALSSSQALAVVVASRVLLIGADVVLAGAALALGRWRRS